MKERKRRRRLSFNWLRWVLGGGGLVLIFALFVALFFSFSHALRLARAYESPGVPSGFVNDFAGMLASGERAVLEEKLRAIEAERGVEIALVTVPDLGGDTAPNFAVKLFEEWGIGKKGADNGLLILVSRDDREVRIEVGYGLEGIMTDAESYWIIQNEIVPAFRAGNFSAGLQAALERIGRVLAGEELPAVEPQATNRGLQFFIQNFFFLVVFIPIWLGSVLGRSKSWWLGGVLGGVASAVIGLIFGLPYFGLPAAMILVPMGLAFDYVVSKAYARGKALGYYPWWIGGRGFGGRGSGGGGHSHFSGFGGGSSGGGGASGKW